MNDNKPTVFVIEDEDLLLDAIVRKLKLSNISVVSCKSGKEAVGILKSLDKIPNAIWLDYYLKDMDGLEFMNAIKKDPRLADIPTIVVSNSASAEKVNSMIALGVKKYYLKAESKLDNIIEHIRDIINQSSKNKN